MRLYVDEDSCDGRLVRELRRLGVEVLAADELGRKGMSDADHLAFAAAEACVLLTGNVGDFHALNGEWARAGREHAGILIWKKAVRRSPENLAASVFQLLTDSPGSLSNTITRVPNVFSKSPGEPGLFRMWACVRPTASPRHTRSPSSRIAGTP